MFQVEVRIRDDNLLTQRMTAMREWLDHRRLEPASFRYTLVAPGFMVRVDFAGAAEAAAFARDFGGSVLEGSALASPATADSRVGRGSAARP